MVALGMFTTTPVPTLPSIRFPVSVTLALGEVDDAMTPLLAELDMELARISKLDASVLMLA